MAQESFKYDPLGLNPKYIVVEVENKTQMKLFQCALNWIKETYKNPNEVIQMTMDSSKIRFEGFAEKLLCSNMGNTKCKDYIYSIELEFKDGKYKFTPIYLQTYVPPILYSEEQVRSVDINNGSAYYKNLENNAFIYRGFV